MTRRHDELYSFAVLTKKHLMWVIDDLCKALSSSIATNRAKILSSPELHENVYIVVFLKHGF